MTDREAISKKLVGVCHLIDIEWNESSYYMNYNRVSRAKEVLEETCEEIKQVEDIRTKEVRMVERLDKYLEEAITEEGDREISDIEDIVGIISNGLARKIEDPDSFQGYKPSTKRCAEKIGLNIRIKGSA